MKTAALTQRAPGLADGDQDSALTPEAARALLASKFRQALAVLPGEPSLSGMARYLHLGRTTVGEAYRIGAGSPHLWALIDRYVGADGELVRLRDEIEARTRPARAGRPNPGKMHAGSRTGPLAEPAMVWVDDCPHCQQPVKVIALRLTAAQVTVPARRRPGAHLRSTRACLIPA